MRRSSPWLSVSLSLVLCMFAASLPAPAQDPLSREAKIERILDLMNAQANANQLFDQITAMVNSQAKTMMPNASPEQIAKAQEFQTKLLDLVKSRMSWEKMRPEFVRIYGETYTDEELDGMLVFFQSPAGRGYLSKVPALTQKVMAFSQAQMSDLMPQIQKMLKDAEQNKR